MKNLLLFLSLIFVLSCKPIPNSKKMQQEKIIITSDIQLFWNVYDKISQTKDTTLQQKPPFATKITGVTQEYTFV